MSLERRLTLLQWAASQRAWIIEDDYDSEFRYSTRPLASLQGMDANGSVIYVGTFSKSLCPGLRLAFAIVPDALIDAFRSARLWSDGHSPVTSQRTLLRFIEDGHYERHLRAMRLVYAERRNALARAIDRDLGDHLETGTIDGGLHCAAWLRKGNAAQIARRAAALDIDVVPISEFSMRKLRRDGLLLGFAPFAPREIRVGARILAQAFQ
jgi:GntR family transcriptional regulator/MocR family aminotransferase